MIFRNQSIIVFFFLAALFSYSNSAQCMCELGSTGDSTAVAAVDPNALTGPEGYGPKHYIPADTLIAYQIAFENDSGASAPAQQVDITNQLEHGLDWESFELAQIAFGDEFIAVPAGTKQFETKLAMNFSDVEFEVHINAGIDPATGEVYAHFYCIDPATGWPPPVNIGFLPPENGTGRGMGYISYVINPKATLEENSEIRNVALIVFDQGERIYTNQTDPHDPSQGTDPELEAPVTIDRERPVSRVISLPGESISVVFTVAWEGDDTASGIAGYNVYTRTGTETAWSVWQKNTTATSAQFTGIAGQTYEFFCTANDNVGYIEQKSPVPETRICITPGAPPDFDEDGVPDDLDNCPEKFNPDQKDENENGIGDACESAINTDSDNDSIPDEIDNCPYNANTDQADADGDGKGDVCDTCPNDKDNDSDGDGICGDIDNCPLLANPDQMDKDADGYGDVCDICPEDPDNDSDGDGICAGSQTSIVLNTATIEWQKNKARFKGKIDLPSGLHPENMAPQAMVKLEIGNLDPVMLDQVNFSVKGNSNPKWKYKNGKNQFDIDWENASFSYNDFIKLDACHFGKDYTDLELKIKNLNDDFTLILDHDATGDFVSIQVADSNITVLPSTIEHNRIGRKKIQFRVPFALTRENEIVLKRPGLSDTRIPVEDFMTNAAANFDLSIQLDPKAVPDPSLPPTVKLTIILGQQDYTGYSIIDSGWKIINEKKWVFQ